MPLRDSWVAARAPLERELRPTFELALPVVIAELGWMAMSVVDTMMVGRLSAEAIGAVSIGAVLFYAIGVFGTGMLLGLDTLVPQAYGAGDFESCHRSLAQSIYGGLLLGPALMLPMFAVVAWLPQTDLAPEVVALAQPYTRALLWSTLPLLLFMSFRHYLQGMGKVAPVMVVLVSANVINALANWVFIHGKLGAPPMGVEGAGWASCASRVYMLLAILGYIAWDARGRRTGLFVRRCWSFQFELFRRLGALSFPAAMQRALEIGVFAAATALIGTLDAVSLAAHQVALQAASVTFMVPLGISSAAAVRVGQALGRRDPDAAHHAGWAALALGGGFMLIAGLIFVLFPQAIIRIFTDEPAVITVGTTLLYVAALFQLFDGFQVVATGALRGAGDTRTAMLSNLIGHWLLGLPVGWWLCFQLGYGAVGLWLGLSLGLIAVGSLLVYVWSTRLEHLRSYLVTLAARAGR